MRGTFAGPRRKLRWLIHMGLPVKFGIFASAECAFGGGCAACAVSFNHACARYAGLTGRSAFLNLGGVENLSWGLIRALLCPKPMGLTGMTPAPPMRPSMT